MPEVLAKDTQEAELGTPDGRILPRAESFSRAVLIDTIEFAGRDASGNVHARVLDVHVHP